MGNNHSFNLNHSSVCPTVRRKHTHQSTTPRSQQSLQEYTTRQKLNRLPTKNGITPLKFPPSATQAAGTHLPPSPSSQPPPPRPHSSPHAPPRASRAPHSPRQAAALSSGLLATETLRTRLRLRIRLLARWGRVRIRGLALPRGGDGSPLVGAIGRAARAHHAGVLADAEDALREGLGGGALQVGGCGTLAWPRE